LASSLSEMKGLTLRSAVIEGRLSERPGFCLREVGGGTDAWIGRGRLQIVMDAGARTPSVP
jgi:hypothetical protein